MRDGLATRSGSCRKWPIADSLDLFVVVVVVVAVEFVVAAAVGEVVVD